MLVPVFLVISLGCIVGSMLCCGFYDNSAKDDGFTPVETPDPAAVEMALVQDSKPEPQDPEAKFYRVQ